MDFPRLALTHAGVLSILFLYFLSPRNLSNHSPCAVAIPDDASRFIYLTGYLPFSILLL
jgi:hypothetical protein